MKNSGVLVIDKPKGMTSHDVVSRVRRLRSTREVGHAGTLDPMATGVLVIMLGEATKLAPYLTAADKEYETEIALGIETDSLDADGKEVSRLPLREDWKELLNSAIAEETRRTKQVPPNVSAIHVEGERAHARARRGEVIELAPRDVNVRSIELLGTQSNSLLIKVAASKGYYVRALARDLAQHLDTVGHLTRLRRLRSGRFSLVTAVALEDVAQASPIQIAEAAALSLPISQLTATGEALARVGKILSSEHAAPAIEGTSAWLSESGALVAIGDFTGGFGKVRRGFMA